jgi:basic membrane protein A
VSKSTPVFVLLALGLAGGGLSCAPRPQDCARPQVVCAGLVTEFGPVSTGINREAWLGLQDAKNAGQLSLIDRIETVDTRDRAANIATLADHGYDVVVTVGYSMADLTAEAAKAHPSVYFIGVEQPQVAGAENLVGLVFHEEQSGYLAGVLAGIVSQTGRVAGICESRFIDQMRRYCDGFLSGARSIESVKAAVAFREGSTSVLFHDSVWGSAAAEEALDQGADVIFAAGGATADAALATSAKAGAMVIGAETDQYDRLPALRPYMLSSAISDIRGGVRYLVGLWIDGSSAAGPYFGDTGLAPFHDLDGHIGTKVRNRVMAAEVGLSQGTVLPDVPYLSP